MRSDLAKSKSDSAQPAAAAKGRDYSIESVRRCLKIVEALAESPEMGVVDLGKKVSLHYSTVFRFLNTLAEHGWVRQDPKSERYALTLKVYQLGKQVLGRTSFAEVARPVLRDLNQKTGETIFLGILADSEPGITVIESFPSLAPVTVNLQLGRIDELYCSSIGKAYLAFMDPENQDSMIDKIELKPRTYNTIRSVARLKQELAQIRERGYALDNEEAMLGVRCIAGPVLDHQGKVIASFSVSGPSTRMTEKHIEEIAPLVVQASREISSRLGYSPPAE